MAIQRSLTEKQREFLREYVQRSSQGETDTAIAKEFGISRKTLWEWKNTDTGKQIQREHQEKLLDEAIPVFNRVLIEKVNTGSYKHMELFAKIRELLPNTKQELTIENKGSEIVQKGLDANELARIEKLLQDDTSEEKKEDSLQQHVENSVNVFYENTGKKQQELH
ncbi:phBC6A51 family helix-turn-helix protein [Priestia sp. JV24]|uniref:phBC6A51 family helix-turn-helix protein n=1 Tax=Priestia TaxID=2800373 RepID=UPI0021D66D17|nr:MULTISPECIES: phBC6A51 family helix-turn-helix protein [Priestia]MCU7708343.1 phBC6A51 family helix-turn-helix protein [Priestia megaterium]MCW1047969.1 phBC6A51 family helix-turn-helix protein [Priestia sp. JV24]